jgi:hypothetical protein
MQDVSVFGSSIAITASNTFPSGFIFSEFADNADPFDIPELDIADATMGANGDLITWTKATKIVVTMAFIPGSPEDINMAILFEANRAAKGKASAADVITTTVVYPSGATLTLNNGRLVKGMAGESLASDGRLKPKVYTVNFENMVRTTFQ